MKKYFIAIYIILILMCTDVVLASGSANINLASGDGEYISITSNSAVVELGGRSALEVKNGNFNYISFKLDNSYIYGVKKNSVITVSYFDGTSGGFYIRYIDESGKIQVTETVSLGGSNKWKNYSFEIDNATYSDGISNADFRIYITSENSVAFSDVYLRVKPVHFDVKINEAGNNFTEKEGGRIVLVANNQISEKSDFKAELTVKDDVGNRVFKNMYDLSVEGNTFNDIELVASGLEPEFYTANVKVISGEDVFDFDKSFSISKDIAVHNDGIFGMCTHLHPHKKDSQHLIKSVEILKKSGVKWIRDEYYWDRVETEKGVYNFYADDYINACVEAGIEPFVVLNYGNALYGGVPHDEAGYKAFANYAAAVAEHLKGKVKCYEVWNEFNAAWNDGYGVDVYANILKYTYDALKAVDTEITVVAGATNLTRTAWFDSLFQIEIDGKSMYEYCDAVSYHPYSFPYSPEYLNLNANIEVNVKSMNNMMKKYGTPKPQWITEIGWYTGTAGSNVSEEEQAMYLARSFIQAKIHGVEKVFWYDLMDDGLDSGNREDNFGVISNANSDIPYQPKPSYLSYAAASAILGDTEAVNEYKPTENLRIVTFRNIEENKEVNAIYSVNNKATPFILTGDNLKLEIYDAYGAKCRIKEITGAPVYIVGEIGGFDISEIITPIRTHGIATCGSTFKNDGVNIVSDEVSAIVSSRRNSYLLNASDKSIDIDIDDSWVYSENTKLQFSVDYYANRSGNLYIEYKLPDGTIKKTSEINLNGKSGFYTSDFEIDTMMCSNGFGNHDLKIKTDGKANINIIAIKAEEFNNGTPVIKVDFDNEIFESLDNGTGLNVDLEEVSLLGRDGSSNFRYVEKEGRNGIYVPGDGIQNYIHVDVKDDILYGGLNDITVTVDYFDEGSGCFSIACGAGSYDWLYELGTFVYLEDTHCWKTAVFKLDYRLINMENNITDFRIALWTGRMGQSPEGITFGGFRIRNNKNEVDFKVEYSEKEKAINISGYNDSDSAEFVTIEILGLGKTTEDIISNNLNGTVIHFGEAENISYSDHKYFEYSFKQDMKTGLYLVRVNDGKNIMEKYLYYYNLYDVDRIILTDSKGNEVNSDMISGIEKLNVSTKVTSNYDNTDLCLAVAVYDGNGKLKAVNYTEDYAIAGEISDLQTVIEIPSEINEGDKIKIFILKGMSTIIPVRTPEVLSIK